MRAIVWMAVAGCGRIGFDPGPGGSAAASDTATDHSGQSYVATVLADHPLAYYRFDETSGTVARDASGHGFDATYTVSGGQLALGTPGAIAGDPDTAVELAGDGNSQVAFVAFPSSVYTFSGDFTVEGWITPAQPPAGKNDAFFVWEVYNVSGFRTGWEDTLEPLLWVHESGGTGDVIGAKPVAVGAWNYLVFVRSGATMSVYLDGQLAGTGSPSYIVPPATGFVGGLGACDGIPAGTSYDEVALYAYALDASQVAAHYTAAR